MLALQSPCHMLWFEIFTWTHQMIFYNTWNSAYTNTNESVFRDCGSDSNSPGWMRLCSCDILSCTTLGISRSAKSSRDDTPSTTGGGSWNKKWFTNTKPPELVGPSCCACLQDDWAAVHMTHARDAPNNNDKKKRKMASRDQKKKGI